MLKRVKFINRWWVYGAFAVVLLVTVPPWTEWGMGGRPNHNRRMLQAHAKSLYVTAVAFMLQPGAKVGEVVRLREHLRGFQEAGVDQVILLQQAGRNRHDHICQSLELFAAEVMPDFKREAEAREAAKAKRLAPYIEAALARKPKRAPLADHEIPVVKASVAKAQVNQGSAR